MTARARSALLLAPALALALGACGGEPAAARRPHVVVWLVDTLRADRLGTYGYARDTSPRLDALADAGVVFEHFHVGSNWTQPSVASLLSGHDPPIFSEDFTTVCPESLEMAAEHFSAGGYETAGLTVTMATARRFGFAQGYDHYVELDEGLSFLERRDRTGRTWDADHLVDEGLAWIDARAADEARPFFLTLHSVDPHTPYETHPELPSFTGPYDGPMDGQVETFHAARKSSYAFTPEDRRHVADLYDDEVRFNDHHLGRLADELAARGLLDDTLLVVVSDHGEEFWEHGDRGHGHQNLYSELTHVPFVLHWPNGLDGGQRIGALARGVDMLPTLLDLAALPLPERADGRSLAPALRGAAPAARGERLRPVWAFADRAKGAFEAAAVRTDERLLALDGQSGSYGLYAWRASGGETAPDLSEAERETAEKLLDPLLEWLEARLQAPAADSVELDAETRARLEAMGYLR